MSTKKALKEIRNKLAAQEPEGALYEATNLLKSIGDRDAEAPNVLAYRALALTHLERHDEAEKSYLHALTLSPGHHLARPGLKKLYREGQQWDKLARLVEHAVQSAYDERDGEKLLEAMQELVELRLKHGPEEKLYDALSLLVPSSPLVPLLQTTAVPQGFYIPLAMPIYPVPSGQKGQGLPKKLPHVYHLAGSLALVLYILIHVQTQIHNMTETKVKAGRMRIGAKSEGHVRRQVDAEILSGPLGATMIDLLRDVSSHPSVDEAVRRDVEVQEFQYWRKLVVVLPGAKDKATKAPKTVVSVGAKLPSKPSASSVDMDEPPLFRTPQPPQLTKADALSRANGLADGFVLIGVGGSAKEAWSWVLDGRDEPTINYDLDFLHKFAHTFPDSTLTDFIDDYCRFFKLPLPDPEDEDTPPESPTKEANDEKEKVKYRKPRRGKDKGKNARERRKARRLAKRDGALPEEVDEEEREELIASMTKLLEGLRKSVFALRVMARIAIQEEDWVNAIAYAEKARKLVREIESERGIKLPKVQTSLDQALGVALVPYYPPKHHERAARLLKGVLEAEPTDYEARFAVGQIAEYANDWETARGDFQILLDHGGSEREMVAAREELGWCLVNEGKLEEGRDVLEAVVEVRDTRKEQENKDDEKLPRARAWWRLGRTEWMIGDAESKEHAQEWFMAALRADDSFAPAYTALGICYAEASPPDTERSLKCFQKAFELDATEAEAARRLAYGYADNDEWAQVRAIATRVMEGEGGVEGVAGGEVMNAAGRYAPKNVWAWKALGSTEMYYKNYAKAITSYQIALRAAPEDAGMWRMLGDAYVKSGRHMAGLKALEHALELEPDMWMARYHVGEVYAQLGAYENAIKSFQVIEDVTEAEVGVTAALAESTFSLGRQAAAGGFRGRARHAFHQAIEYAAKVLGAGRSHRAWGWKLVGDAALLLAEHEATPEDMASTAAVLHPVLELLVADDDDRRSAVAGLGHASNLLQAAPSAQYTLKAAVFAFAYRAHLLKNETRVADPALYDLGCVLHTLMMRTSDDGERAAATKAAVAAVRLALEREPGDERLWNALGVITSAAGVQLAQHAFVVSLECYAKDPVVWTNLGYLYLQLDDLELANECFLKSQIIDPDYSRAWFGQGILAHRDGNVEQAASLFAHAVTLSTGSLLEADLALAVQAFAPFTHPNNRDTTALQAPAFALKRYTHSRPRDAAAQHLYALVCERLGLADTAVSALEAAVTLFEEEFEATESPDVEASYIIALTNLGRVRLAAGQYAAALEAYTNSRELSAGATDPRVVALTVQNHLGTALAHFWLDDLDASLEAFQAALDASKNDNGMTDELVVLLARTLWGVGGEEARDAAKTQLMECLEHEDPSVKVIAALGAVGLGSSDGDLVDAAVAELEGVPPARRVAQDPRGAADLVLFATALSKGDTAGALTALEVAAATNLAPGPRNRLAAAYVAAGKTAEAGTLLDSARAPRIEDAAEADRLRGVAATLEGQDGLENLQRAVMLTPWDEKAWEALAWARRALVEVEGA